MSKLNDEQKQHIDRIATKMAENMQDRDTLARDKMLCSAFLIGLVQNHQKPEDGRLAFPIEASWSEASKRITDTELGLLHKLGRMRHQCQVTIASLDSWDTTDKSCWASSSRRTMPDTAHAEFYK